MRSSVSVVVEKRRFRHTHVILVFVVCDTNVMLFMIEEIRRCKCIGICCRFVDNMRKLAKKNRKSDEKSKKLSPISNQNKSFAASIERLLRCIRESFEWMHSCAVESIQDIIIIYKCGLSPREKRERERELPTSCDANHLLLFSYIKQ